MRPLRIVLLLGLLFVIGMVATPASAHSNKWADSHRGNDTGVNESVHAGLWATNGCTAVPDSVWGVFYFEHACDHHDGCYGGHWASRSGCDGEFWRNMEASCVYDWSWWSPSRPACRVVRDTYYTGVRAFGGPAYYGWSISALIG